ncbi:hypothetical protein [Amphritea balenae]|uniref:Uncharacterized protein n=1 Tax=Amphritea balenae TaxID=452629 RepID=A0A3P1SUF6_9GAMM|nr:hypothetical protein [Amphritea balenae]RRD00186.1 hypothetical protein EHS89_08245 [Amphritea balenae]GGK77365.1 hypothetical protein GCM10007941_29400 [Amphritea balenae]
MHLLRYGAMVTTGLLLSVNQAQATIQTDLSAGLPLTSIIQNAVSSQTSLETILDQILTNCDSKAIPDPALDNKFIVCTAGSLESIISAAVVNYSDDTESLQMIGQSGLEEGLSLEQLIQIAINNGIDPAALLPPAAAGAPPAPAGQNFTPSPFGNNTGGGGGGNISPS